MIRRFRAFLRKLGGATPTATHVEELRPLRWTVDGGSGRRWILVRSEFRWDGDATIVLTLRDEASLRASRIPS